MLIFVLGNLKSLKQFVVRKKFKIKRHQPSIVQSSLSFLRRVNQLRRFYNNRAEVLINSKFHSFNRESFKKKFKKVSKVCKIV